jgi:hypothetical protein
MSLLADSLPDFFHDPKPSFRIEESVMREGYLRVAGLDEVGRGPHLPAKIIRLR